MKLKLLTIAFSSMLVALPALGYTGTAYFSAPINWSDTGNLFFTVAGGPPNTCGDLSSIRNGQTLYGAGWLCTDANGNAVKGPWTWAGTPGNQTDIDLKIIWPGGTTTNPLKHIWDKSCPTLTATSPTGAPPSSFFGRADDNGAGFNQSWTEIAGGFIQVETNTFWRPGDTSYSRPIPGPIAIIPTVTGWPFGNQTDLLINWSFPQVPPASAHVPGYHYKWIVEMTDGDGRCYPTLERAFTAQ